MRTKNFDPNEEFAYREKFCKRGISPDTTAYLPIKRPPFYKRRIAELSRIGAVHCVYSVHSFFTWTVRQQHQSGNKKVFRQDDQRKSPEKEKMTYEKTNTS